MNGSGDAVPWDTLLESGNLTTLLKAVVDRLDKQDKTIATGLGGVLPGAQNSGVDMGNVTIIDIDDLAKLRERLDVLENVTIQNRMSALKDGEGQTLQGTEVFLFLLFLLGKLENTMMVSPLLRPSALMRRYGGRHH